MKEGFPIHSAALHKLRAGLVRPERDAIGDLPLGSTVDALSDRGCESNLGAACHLHVIKVKRDRLLGPRKERLPGRHLRIEPSRDQGRRDIEHQHVRVVIFADRRPVFFTNGSRPAR
jgi:hypothetical protein